MHFNWKNGNLSMPCIEYSLNACANINFVCFSCHSFAIEYSFDYVILFALNEKLSVPQQRTVVFYILFFFSLCVFIIYRIFQRFVCSLTTFS